MAPTPDRFPYLRTQLRYAEWTAKACEQDGIRLEIRECEPEKLESELRNANEVCGMSYVLRISGDDVYSAWC